MLSWFARRLPRTTLVALIATFAATSAHALPVSFTRIVDTNTTIPGGSGTFSSVTTRPVLEGTRTAFVGSDGAGVQALYVHETGSNTLVAGTGTAVPGGTGNFGNGISSVSSDGSATAFRAVASGGQTGAYLDSGSGLVSIADLNTVKPGSSATFQQVDGVSLDGGKVAFFASENPLGTENAGIYRGTGGALTVLADGSTVIPDDGRLFTRFSAITASDADAVAFIGGVSGSLGVFRWEAGSLTKIANRSDAVPDGVGNFAGFFDVTLDDGDVAFIAQALSSQEGLYTNIAGVLSAVADKNTAIPDGTGNFTRLLSNSLSDEKLVFIGEGASGQRGIYTDFSGSLEKLLDLSDTLDGKSIASLELAREAFEGDRFVFHAEFTDGSKGIYLATIPEPATALLFGAGLVALATRRRALR